MTCYGFQLQLLFASASVSIQKCPPFKVRALVWVIYGGLAAPPRRLREPMLVFLICVRASLRSRVPTPGSEAAAPTGILQTGCSETPIPPSLLTVARLWSLSWSQNMSEVRPWSRPSSSGTALTSTSNVSRPSVHVGRGWSWDTPSPGLWRRCKHLESNQQPADCSAGVPELDKMTVQEGSGLEQTRPIMSHILLFSPVWPSEDGARCFTPSPLTAVAAPAPRPNMEP